MTGEILFYFYRTAVVAVEAAAVAAVALPVVTTDAIARVARVHLLTRHTSRLR